MRLKKVGFVPKEARFIPQERFIHRNFAEYMYILFLVLFYVSASFFQEIAIKLALVFLLYFDVDSGDSSAPEKLVVMLLVVQRIVVVGSVLTSVPVKHELAIVQTTDSLLFLDTSQIPGNMSDLKSPFYTSTFTVENSILGSRFWLISSPNLGKKKRPPIDQLYHVRCLLRVTFGNGKKPKKECASKYPIVLDRK